MNETIKKNSFDFFSGKADQQSVESVSEYLSSEEDGLRQLSAWEKEWSSTNIPTVAQVNAFSAITARIKARRRARIARWTASMASAAVLALVLFVWKPFAAESEKVENLMCTVETGFCEKTKITLPDSTQVWLNSASKITYPSNFAESERVVTLEGEAFFDVAKNPARPFVVNFGDGCIRVLGTKFNISSYASERLYQAALLEGSIEFSTSGATVEMRPGEVLTYDIFKEEMKKTRTDASKYASWLNNKLDYDSITLDKLVRRLSSIYGVRIYCKSGKYLSQPFGVMLDLHESLPNILDGLSLILDVKWTSCADGSIYINENNNS